jgi:hypothetical protein
MSLWFGSASSAPNSATNREILSPLLIKGLNLLAAQIMSKPARTIFPEKQDLPRPAVGFSLPAWLCPHKK